MDPDTKKKIIIGAIVSITIVAIIIVSILLSSNSKPAVSPSASPNAQSFVLPPSSTPTTAPTTSSNTPTAAPSVLPVNTPLTTVAVAPSKFKQLYSTNYAYGIAPQQATGGGGNVSYLGKANSPEECEAICANTPWCSVYTSFDSTAPYSNDCFGMRSVPDYPGVTFTGNGATVSGVRI